MHRLYQLNTSCNMPSPFPNAPLTRYWEPGVSWRVGEYCLVTYADRTGRQCATTFVCLVNRTNSAFHGRLILTIVRQISVTIPTG